MTGELARLAHQWRRRPTLSPIMTHRYEESRCPRRPRGYRFRMPFRLAVRASDVDRDPSSAAEPRRTAFEAAPGSTADAFYAWHTGMSLDYEVDLEAQGTIRAGAASHLQQVVFDATLRLRVLEVVDERAWLEVSVPTTRAFSIEVDGRGLIERKRARLCAGAHPPLGEPSRRAPR